VAKNANKKEDKVMITRISTLVAIVVSGGILLSAGSPALAKGAGLKSNVSISREAKLIRVIRVNLVKQKLKRVVEKPVALNPTGRLVEKPVALNPTGRLVEKPVALNPTGRLVEKPVGLIEKGRVNGNATRAERIGDPLVAKAKRTADPAEVVTGGQPARRAE
jgi:hypothetical protein